MASPDEQLPEGTDTIIEGAGVDADDENQNPATGASNDEEPPISAMSGAGDAKGAFFERVDELRGQATDRARDLAQAGKDRATSALDSLVQTVEDAAAEIDQKLGSQYGDYARRAAEHIGNFSDSFRDKDVDELFNDAREFVKKSPAVAIGAAAALGFVVARLARAGMPEGSGKDAPEA
jgi:ElaB/YqjD/DUF883 family membrane-anchored ribosome-binding protein